MKKTRLFKTVLYHYRNEKFLKFFCRILRFMLSESVRGFQLVRLWLTRLTTKESHVVKDILGSKMVLDLNDKGISFDLLMNGIREDLATGITQKIVREGDVIIDIGGNIGYYALLESRLTGPKGKVFAIEPVFENVQKIKKNIALNNYFNIDVFQLAIGNKNEMSSIYLSDRSNWCSMKHRENITVNNQVKKQDIEVMTLDRFLEGKPFPDLIRMDVEGYEYEIFQGMEGILKTGKPLKIFFEIHIDDLKEKTDELVDLLYQNGFKFKIGAWKELRSRSRLLKNVYNFLSERIQPNSTGCFYADTIDDVKRIFSRGRIFPQVLFERE